MCVACGLPLSQVVSNPPLVEKLSLEQEDSDSFRRLTKPALSLQELYPLETVCVCVCECIMKLYI